MQKIHISRTFFVFLKHSHEKMFNKWKSIILPSSSPKMFRWFQTSTSRIYPFLCKILVLGKQVTVLSKPHNDATGTIKLVRIPSSKFALCLEEELDNQNFSSKSKCSSDAKADVHVDLDGKLDYSWQLLKANVL